MHDPVVWLIIAAFYAPLHFLLPVLFIVITADSRHRQLLLRHAIIDSALSMLAVFVLAIWLIPEYLMSAMLVMAIGMATPFIRIMLQRFQHESN